MTGGNDGKIFVHKIRDGYKLVSTLDLRDFHQSEEALVITDLTFLAPDNVMVVIWKTGIFFLFVQSGDCISHCQVVNSKILTTGGFASADGMDTVPCFGLLQKLKNT